MDQRWLFTLLSLAISCSTTFAGTFSIKVKVVDADQKPIGKADVALFWNVQNGAMIPAGEKPIVTDADGKAVLRVDDWNEKRPLLALSADRKFGGLAGVSRTDDGKEVIVTLRPTVRVKGNLECKELHGKPEWANTMVAADGFRPPFVQHSSMSAAFAFVLPAGKYTFRSYGTDVDQVVQTVILTADRAAYDLGTFNLKATPIAKLKGQVLPGWTIAVGRGVKADVKLSDYKGKWVYIEFWGFW